MAEAQLDLSAYLRRIALPPENAMAAHGPSLELLQWLHRAHATHVPFENVDVLLGRRIDLDLPALEEKIVRQGRGGYCFEQNMLLAAVLEQLGFRVTRLLARVHWWTARMLPRTHMVLKIDIGQQSWLADVGFGGWGLLEAIPLCAATTEQFAWSYRLLKEQDAWHVQTLAPSSPAAQSSDGLPATTSGGRPATERGRHPLEAPLAWQAMYTFTLDLQLPVDYEPANYYVYNHPDSRFTQTLIVSLPDKRRRSILMNRELIVYEPGEVRVRTLADDQEVLEVLSDTFQLQLPSGTSIRRRYC